MSSFPKVTITVGMPHTASIAIDGVTLPTRHISVEQGLDGIAKVTVEMISDDITIDGEAACGIQITNPSEDQFNRVVEAVLARLQDVGRRRR